ISGTRTKEKLIAFITEKVTSAGFLFTIDYTNATGNYTLLKEKVIADKFTDIVIVGGDGSVNQVVQAFAALPVRFGILPVGSGNGLARAAGIPTKIKRALQVIIEGNTMPVDGFTINDAFSCMLSGLGFDAQVAHNFARKAKRGLFNYTKESLLHFFKAQPYGFEIKLPEFSFFTDAFLISIANSNQFGNNVTIAPQAKLNDGLLDVIVVQKMHKVKLPYAILKQLSGNNKMQQLVEDMEHKNIVYFQTPSLEISNLKLAPLHIDGEAVASAQHLSIKVLPNYFTLFVPASRNK
ncbi:MAG: YegS/Rv2252/BmrU family lipid kinase, partial [Sediminibacterium sp.]